MTQDSKNQDLLQAFDQHLDGLNLQRTKVFLILLLFVVPSGVLLDLVVYPSYASRFLLIRLACVVVLLALLLLMSTGLRERWPRVFGIAWSVPMVVYVEVMIFISDGFMSQYYVGIAFVASLGGMFEIAGELLSA